jgi:hypothetical protein
MVEFNHNRGTIFSIDVDGREYWITAKHILTGAEHPPYGSVTQQSVTLTFLDPNSPQEHWVPMTFAVIDPGPDIDIVALAPPYAVSQQSIQTVAVGGDGTMVGGDCEFLGFPYGGGWQATFQGGAKYWAPFVKHCTMSGTPGGGIYILDGINNEGFSGGPVMFNTGPKQKVFAVISGYHLEPAQVIASAQHKPERIKPPQKRAAPPAVNVNSGFIIAYAIDAAIDAIHKHPIGPVRQPQGAQK